jgi:hypothetical protein
LVFKNNCLGPNLLLEQIGIGQEGVATTGSIGGGGVELVVALSKSETKCEFINSGQ